MKLPLLAALLSLFLSYQLYSQTQFSQQNATKLLYHLSVEIGPRPMGSPAEHQAMLFALEKFKEYGCDTEYILPMTRSTRMNTASGIAVGIKRGATNRMIVIGGHIDSVEPEVEGANDDGSGAVTVLEASRVLCSTPHQSTLVFCCFGGEEQGLEGSNYFVNHFPEIDNVALMLQTDMANGLSVIDLMPETYGKCAPKWLVRAAVEEYYKSGYRNLRYATFFSTLNNIFGAGAGSDHESFLAKGIPAIDFTTDPSDPIHNPRDNFENFDPRGLQRSGDVVLKLVNRFDVGVPDKTTEEYFLFILDKTPIFVPFWLLWVAGCLALVVAIAAFIFVRKLREVGRKSGQFTFFKILLFTVIIVCFGWFSSNLVGSLQGIRHPWMAYPDGFYWLAILGVLTGAIVTAWLTNRLSITKCPYKLFRTSVLLLLFWLVLSLFAGVKVAMAPLSGLFLISLAMLVRNGGLRLFLVALSPFWMLRLLFSEWKELFFRALGLGLPGDILTTLIFNTVMVLFFTLYVLPFVFAIASVLRTLPSVTNSLQILKSKWTLAFTFIVYLSCVVSCTNIPAYNTFWFRNIDAKILSDLDTKQSTFKISSSEYLDRINVSYDGVERQLSGWSTSKDLPLPATFDSALVHIQHLRTTTNNGNTTEIADTILLTTKIRPYRVTVSFPLPSKMNAPTLISPYLIATTRDDQRIDFFSFPETSLIIPTHIQLGGSGTVTEKISVLFCELPSGVEIDGELCYVIPRTEFVEEWK